MQVSAISQPAAASDADTVAIGVFEDEEPAGDGHIRPADRVGHGGLGGGATDAISVMEAIGDALIVEPWLATVALGAQLVARGGSEEQRQRMLPAVAQGLHKLAFAYAEPNAKWSMGTDIFNWVSWSA